MELFSALLSLFSAVVAVGILIGASTEKLHDLDRLRFFLIYAGVFYYLSELSKDHLRWVRILATVTVIVAI